jgi:two-component system phosphate regulon response regulator PhoB
VRSTVFRFEDFTALALALKDAEGSELPAPEGEIGPDGEWVLAIFEVGERRKATAAAARIVVKDTARRILFEERDWERLVSFAFARSGHFKAARIGLGGATSSSNYPVLSPDETAPLPTLPGVPDSPPSAPASFRDSAPPVSSRIPNARVLIVDDDDGTREFVQKTLEGLSLTVIPMVSADDGSVALTSRVFDLVVLDFGLPRGAGLSLVRALRKNQATAQTPVLFVAEPGGSRDAVEAFASGADDFVTKPLRASELSARIIGLLRRARTSQPPEKR